MSQSPVFVTTLKRGHEFKRLDERLLLLLLLPLCQLASLDSKDS